MPAHDRLSLKLKGSLHDTLSQLGRINLQLPGGLAYESQAMGWPLFQLVSSNMKRAGTSLVQEIACRSVFDCIGFLRAVWNRLTLLLSEQALGG